MKVWTSDHTFNHPWHTVVNAALRKYPNPENKAVTGIDVVQQKLENGVLKSERVLQSHFSIPAWASRLTGFNGTQYSYEFTEIDPARQRMTLATRNLNGCSFLRLDERLTYIPHPENPEQTLLRQEAAVVVSLPAFTDYCEKAFLSTYQSNAFKGRLGIEWVIGQLKKEYNQIASKIGSASEMQWISVRD